MRVTKLLKSIFIVRFLYVKGYPIHKIINLLFWIFILLKMVSIIVLLKSTKIPVDAGYFLPLTRDLYLDHSFPMIHTKSNYGIVGFVIYGLPYLFTKNPDISAFFYVNLSIAILSSLFFYSISKKYIAKYSFAFTVMYFSLISASVGDIKLENIQVLFASLIVYFCYLLVHRKNPLYAVFIGFLIAVSVFTKQFALTYLFFVPAMMFLMKDDGIVKNIIKIYAVFVVTFLLIALTLIGLTSLEFQMEQFLGREDSCLTQGISYGQRSLLNLPHQFMQIIKIAPAILLMIFQIPSWKNRLIYLGIIIFVLVPNYLMDYNHYLLVGMPFLYFITTFLLKEVNLKSLMILFALLPVVPHARGSIAILNNRAKMLDQKIEQNEVAKALQRVIPVKSTLYINNVPKELMFQLKGNSPNQLLLGYQFMHKMVCIDLVSEDSWYLITDRSRHLELSSGNVVSKELVRDYVVYKIEGN